MKNYLKKLSKKSDSKNINDQEKEECCICFGYFEKGGEGTEWMEDIVELKCDGKHKYHLKCMEEWTEYK